MGSTANGLFVNEIGQDEKGWINLSLAATSEAVFQVFSAKGKAVSMLIDSSDSSQPGLLLLDKNHKVSAALPKSHAHD